MTTEDRLAVLEAGMARLLDRQAIYDCIARTSRGNDRFDIDLITGSYHEDGVHELGSRKISGQEYGEHANHAHRAMCMANLHNVTMHSCEIDGDVAHAESYVIGLFLDNDGETSRMLAGRYIDRLERRDGEWRIALRPKAPAISRGAGTGPIHPTSARCHRRPASAGRARQR